jgi:predicted amidohydrolase
MTGTIHTVLPHRGTPPQLAVGCVQLNSRDDVAANRAVAERLVREAAAAGARLIVLPETWTYKGSHERLAEVAEAVDGPSNALLARLAAELNVYVLAGSLYEPAAAEGRFYNTSALFGPRGDLLATYRKLHLFDAVAGTRVYRESDDLTPGDAIVTAEVDGVVVGLTICYDLRFPELYRELTLHGARLLLVPSAFTSYTGRAHWQTLLRARAIENGCFVAAAAQYGPHGRDRHCWGRSMIVDPWGTVLTTAPDGVGVCLARLDLSVVDDVRAQIPVLASRRPDVYSR